jgi:tetratricopeptide (TPR) repeat protein
MSTRHRLPLLLLTTVLIATVLVVLPLSIAAAQADLISQAKRLDAQGQQTAAIALYRQALTKAPKSFDAHYGLARALDLDGDYSEARSHFMAAIDAAPDAGARDQAMRMMALSWIFSGNVREATPFFKRVFDRRLAAGDVVGAAEVANELGRALLESGDAAGAFDWYRTGHGTALQQPKVMPRDVDLAEMRWEHAQARVAARRGNMREAQRHAAQVKALLDKGTNADQRIQYPYLTGYLAFYAGDDAKAIAELRQADQEDPFILVLLAQVYERSGQAAQARSAYTKVLASTSHGITNAFARPIAKRKLGK